MKEEMRNACYKCLYRGTVPGDAHSSCQHPATKTELNDPLGQIMAIFASVGRASPIAAIDSAKELDIRADSRGINNNWFNWPWNFDPVWLIHCEGFKEKEAK